MLPGAGFEPGAGAQLVRADRARAGVRPHRSIQIGELQVAGTALGRKHGIRRGRDVVIDGDMAHRVIAALAHANDIARLVNGRIAGDLRHRIVGGAAPPAVAALHVANDVHLIVRAGRDVDVAGPGRNVEGHRTVYAKRSVKGPFRGQPNRRQTHGHGNQNAGCRFTGWVPSGLHFALLGLVNL